MSLNTNDDLTQEFELFGSMENISEIQSTDTQLCPLCRENIKQFIINDSETVTMCPNTSCSYPFFSKENLRIELRHQARGKKNIDLQKCESQNNKDEFESFDIEKFLEETKDVEQFNNTEAMADVINELLAASALLL